MKEKAHWAIFIDNRSEKSQFIDQLLHGPLPEPMKSSLESLQGALFSKLEIDRFLEEEAIHDAKILTADRKQSLQSMSSGERKKALLAYLLAQQPDFLILDNPFDNLDVASQESLGKLLQDIAHTTILIQLMSRRMDRLPFIENFAYLQESTLEILSAQEVTTASSANIAANPASIPPPLEPFTNLPDPLVALNKVSVTYDGKPVLHDICWKIHPGQFWQLSGANGSGKTTLLSMITGDNPKAYGQDMYLFGQRKGSGESVWEIKKNLGYFTPAMIDRFRGYHSLENMLISGLNDSIGLYVQPTEAQLRIARGWLQVLGLQSQGTTYFHDLSLGMQRLVMCARAMVKHPPLLILDEPTAGLDDDSALLFVSLVNKMSRESRSAIIFVSHREEAGLSPEAVYHLEMSPIGSTGKATKL